MPSSCLLKSLAVLAALAIPACSSSPPVRPDVQMPPPGTLATPVPAGPSNRDLLDTERVKLAQLFAGTPVVFLTTSDGNLRATVPRRYCFDPGVATVKPPLAAVLGRVAKSQASTASQFKISVPNDPNARNPNLLRDRANSVRDWLAGQGIAPERMLVTGAPQSEQLELFVVPQPAM